MCRVDRFLSYAVDLAYKSPNVKHRHAAVLVKGGRIVSFGLNTEKPETPNSHKSLHAEEACFARNNETLSQSPCTLYVARVRLQGDAVTISEPCRDCKRFLLGKTRVKRVYYTVTEGTHRMINLNSLRGTNWQEYLQ